MGHYADVMIGVDVDGPWNQSGSNGGGEKWPHSR